MLEKNTPFPDFHESVDSKDEEIKALREGGAQKDQIIRDLEQKLRQKETLIFQWRQEILRLRGIEDTLAWKTVRRFFNFLEDAVLPSHTRRGRIFIELLSRLRTHPESRPKSEEEQNHPFPGSPQATESMAPFLCHDLEILTFPAATEPRVSIIIAVYNRVGHTYRCLKSILEKTSDIPFEIIVVDDGSTDETKRLSEKVRNIQLIRSEFNLGFVRECNRGAEKARGEYLLFLNNDTEVSEGWLKAMVGLMENDRTVGVVGAKLVFPEGFLQEAGSIVWSDGMTSGYGRGEDPESPSFCYQKEVDYCSGACLLIRKRLFFDLGRFDEIYAPAYFEDADLCLSAKRLGYKVAYQPDAIIKHHEHGSGTREKAVDLYYKNRLKFLKKWGPDLKKHPAPKPGNVLRARDARAGKRMLVVDEIIPVSSLGSGYPRTMALLKDLAELGYVITFFPLADGFPYQPETKDLQRMGVEVFYGEGLNLHHHLQERHDFYDVVIVSRPHNAERVMPHLRKFFPRALILYDAEALYSLREAERLRLSGVPLKQGEESEMLRRELGPMRHADSIIVVSEYEKERMEACGLKNVFRWGYPIRPRPPQKAFEERKGLLFVGGFLQSPSPNEDGVLHFAQAIFPRIQESLRCGLLIAGTNHLESISRLQSDRIAVVGFVEDLTGYYERSRIFVVPTRYGAGISLKLLEAMGHGVPSVVTPLIARQLGLADGQGVLVGKDDEDFAARVVELYGDEKLWNDLQKEGLSFLQKHFDPEEMKSRLKNFFRSLVSG
jgi:GT2 family glycosyltransferase